MFIINEDKSIYITRGDVAFFSIEAKTDTGEKYKFMPGDVVRFKVYGKKDCENVVLSKDFGIETESEEVSIYLEEKDTKFGDVISKPTDYWYEVELNPYTDPQTILGYDEDGAKIFRLFPEGNEKEDDDPITPEDIPVVDEELDLTSTRPVQNQAISRAIAKIIEDVKGELLVHSEAMSEEVEKVSNLFIQDISADFFEDANKLGLYKSIQVYKQGNVISGTVAAVFHIKAAASKHILTIKPAYRPVCANVLVPASIFDADEDEQGNLVYVNFTSRAATIKGVDGSLGMLEAEELGGFYISFTYMTEE